MKKTGFVILIFILNFSIIYSQKAGYTPPKGMPRNIIVILANGMGMNQIEAGIIQKGSEPSYSRFPVTGFCQAWPKNGKTPSDSSTTQALATNKSLSGPNNKYKNIFDLAREQKMKTGFITTESVTGPTSKFFTLDNPDKKDNEALALDYLKSDFDLIIGGGSHYFEKRKDKRNLFKDLKKSGYNLETNSRKIGQIMATKTLSIIEKYEISRASDRKDLLTKAALGSMHSLSTLDGYLLVINDTKIEEADSLNNISLLTEEMIDLDKMTDEISKQAGGETLVIVIGNYEVGGLIINDNSIGKKKSRPSVTWQSRKPTASLAPTYAIGPGSEKFSGMYSPEEIYVKLEGMLMNTRR